MRTALAQVLELPFAPKGSGPGAVGVFSSWFGPKSSARTCDILATYLLVCCKCVIRERISMPAWSILVIYFECVISVLQAGPCVQTRTRSGGISCRGPQIIIYIYIYIYMYIHLSLYNIYIYIYMNKCI